MKYRLSSISDEIPLHLGVMALFNLIFALKIISVHCILEILLLEFMFYTQVYNHNNL